MKLTTATIMLTTAVKLTTATKMNLTATTKMLPDSRAAKQPYRQQWVSGSSQR